MKKVDGLEIGSCPATCFQQAVKRPGLVMRQSKNTREPKFNSVKSKAMKDKSEFEQAGILARPES